MRKYYKPRRSLLSRAFTLILTLTLICAAALTASHFKDEISENIAKASTALAAMGLPSEPSPEPSAPPTPLGAPPPPPGTGSYAFEQVIVETGEPVTYDPCRPIEYVVNRTTEPPGAQELLDQALAEVTAATGLQFSFRGDTTEAPVKNREVYNPELYGPSWAPVLIAWSDESTNPDLAGDILGLGGSSALSTSTAAAYVSGVVELDGPDLKEMLTQANGEARVRSTIMHELAHLVGLGHVEDTNELMNPILIEEVTLFGSGDLTGLSALGSGQCLSELNNPGEFDISYTTTP